MTETFDTTSGYYIPQNVAEIEDYDPDQYGNIWYNVKFEGDAETHMWLAKNKPEAGKKYYGHFEKTKSGKRLRFKVDKLPEEEMDKFPTASPKEAMERQESIYKSVALNNAVVLCASDERFRKDKDTVLNVADRFLEWLKDGKTKPTYKGKDKVYSPDEEPDPQWANLEPPEDYDN